MVKNNNTAGILLAVLATIIWSGNFIVARGVIHQIPPVTLAFFRWACASVIMIPIGWQAIKRNIPAIKANKWLILWASIFGVTMFNTLVYMAGHYTQAINLALVGTTSSPVFSFILAAIFLKEKIPPLRILGLLICLAGILVILSRGSMQNLYHFTFAKGDFLILLGALGFSIYNVITRKKPVTIPPIAYLSLTFWIGSLLLLPFALVENVYTETTIIWSPALLGIILYLGAGASVAAFFCWNGSISRLGAARASIFGNLIPVFSSIEAVIILHEKLLPTHIISMVVIFIGLYLANKRPKSEKTTA